MTTEAKAATYVRICNSGLSVARPGQWNLAFLTGSGGYSNYIEPSQCKNVPDDGNSARVMMDNYGSWRVTSGGSYGSCQEKSTSNPGNLRTYYYKGYAKDGCKN